MKLFSRILTVVLLLVFPCGRRVASAQGTSVKPTIVATQSTDFRKLPKPSQERLEMIKRMRSPQPTSKRFKKPPFLTAGLVVSICSLIAALWQWLRQ